MAIMLILHFLPPVSLFIKAIVDSSILVMMLSPMLLFFILRPLLKHFNDFKRAQKALRDSERQLIQADKMSSLGVLVAATAHELQNPNGVFTLNLPILKDYLGELLPILDRQCKDQEDSIRYRMSYREIREDIIRIIDNLEQSSREISTFISNLKGFSRPSEEMKLASVDLKSIVDQVVSICRTQIAKTIKSFTVDIPEDYPHVLTDTQALKQVLLNLLINAAQAADKENSSLKLRAISGDNWREHTIIEISDNGCGMDEATRQKIFDPFFTTKSATKGTGLGLYICYNLVESMGGHIEVESEPGKGSTFRIMVPNTVAQQTVQN
jgi:signal transduction histidine kinase